MGAMPSQITSLTIVYWTVYLGTDQRQHQSSASLAFVRGIHWGPVKSPHKWPVTRKMFPFDDIIMLRRSISTCITPDSCRPQMGPCWSHEPCYQGHCDLVSRTILSHDAAAQTITTGLRIIQDQWWLAHWFLNHDDVCGVCIKTNMGTLSKLCCDIITVAIKDRKILSCIMWYLHPLTEVILKLQWIVRLIENGSHLVQKI